MLIGSTSSATSDGSTIPSKSGILPRGVPTTGVPVADKFDPRPANLKNETALALTEGEIFQRIVVDGMGIMPGYKFEMSDEEAWKVVSYVMQLQGRK